VVGGSKSHARGGHCVNSIDALQNLECMVIFLPQMDFMNSLDRIWSWYVFSGHSHEQMVKYGNEKETIQWLE
jgi:hypothetical protein